MKWLLVALRRTVGPNSAGWKVDADAGGALDEAAPCGGWSPLTTAAEFDAITVHFQAPSRCELFNVIRHVRA